VELWRLTLGDRVQTCEMFDDTAVGAGVAVMVLEAGAPVLSRRCGSIEDARHVVLALRQDQIRGGWSE
jgi:hypothetical protein